MNESTLLAEIRELLTPFSGLPGDAIVPDTRLQEELGLDSLDATELFVTLTERHGVQVQINLLGELDLMLTVGGLIEAILVLGKVAMNGAYQ